MRNKYTKNEQKAETEEEKLAKKLKRNEYMKEYRRKGKNTETEKEKRARKDKQNLYMKEYKKRKLNAAGETEKRMQEETLSMKYTEHNKFEKGSVNETNSAPKCINGVPQCNEYPVDKDANCILNKESYLAMFDSKTNGPIHEQQWAIEDMKIFHQKLIKFKIYKCQVCHEALPLSANHKKEMSYICSRCTREKNPVKKFSAQNNDTLVSP